MTRRVAILGHWESAGGDPICPTRALARIAQGFTEARPHWAADIIPFGVGSAFVEAMNQAPGHSWAPISVERSEDSTARAGREAKEALDAGLTPLVEGGHLDDPDCGFGFINAFTPAPLGASPTVDELTTALEAVRRAFTGRDVICAASTRRPLLGMTSVLAVDPDLGARMGTDRDRLAVLARSLTVRTLGLPLAPDPARSRESNNWGRIDGSGAAGGVGAIIAAVGGRIIPTGHFLRAALDLDARLDGADLVIVAEPRLHSPALADALLDAITSAAADLALPVVAVGEESSLSAHELAEWGMHGQFVTGTDIPLDEAGARVAKTWAI